MDIMTAAYSGIEGTIIALVAAAILGSRHWWVTRRAQSEQKQYVFDTIAAGHKQLRDFKPIEGVPVNTVLFALFENTLREVVAALDYRTDKIDYKDKHGLRELLVHVFAFQEKFGLSDRKPPEGLRFYEQHFFEKVREIEWLAGASPEPLE